ncbi:MAG: hypothetical protein V3W41_06420 [Planctomycetota bacterium]
MAKRQTNSSRRGRQVKAKSNPFPFVIGGIVLLAVIVAFAVMGSGDDEETPTDNRQAENSKKDTATANKTPKTPVKKAGKLINGKTRSEWRALRKKVDMSLWRKIESDMAAAIKTRAKALTIRKTGSESEFKRLITKAVKAWRVADLESDDFVYKTQAIDSDLWDNAFDREARQLQGWTQKFRGYTGYENQ